VNVSTPFRRFQPSQRSLLRLARQKAKADESWGYRLRLFFTRACLPTVDAIGLAVAVGWLGVALTELMQLFVAAKVSDAEARDILLTLWQIQAGAAGVALPVLLFVIEVSRGGLAGGTRTHEVLLRRSLVLPILASAIVGTIELGVFALGGRPSNVLVPQFAFVFVGTMLGTLYVFYQVVLLTFSESRLHAGAVSLLREKMRLSVDSSAVRRVANAVLCNEVLPQLTPFTYNPLTPDEEEPFVVIRSRRSGTLTDVSPHFLDDLARRFLRARVTQTLTPSPGDAPAADAVPAPPESPTSIRWMCLIGDRLREGRTPLLAFDRLRFPGLDANAIGDYIERSLTLADRDDSESLQSELGYLRDVVLEAIKTGHARQVESRLDLHEALIREFLDSLRRWKVGYDPSSTAREDSTPFRRFAWAELGWLENDFREFADAAVRQADVKFGRLVSGSAYSLALYAIGEAEYYVFSHAVDLMTRPYRAVLRDLDSVPPSQLPVVAGYTALMLREMCQLRLAHDIVHSLDKERNAFARQSGIKVLRTLGRLAKEASDRNRDDDFNDFVDALNSGFARVEHPIPRFVVDDEAAAAAGDPHARRLDHALALQKERRVVALGIAGWFLRRYANGELTLDALRPRLDRLFADIGDVQTLWALALHSTQHDVDQEMGWSDWVLFEKANMGRAMFLDTDTHLWRAFFIAAIRRIGSAGNAVNLPPSEGARDAIAVADGDFWRVLKEFQEDSQGLEAPQSQESIDIDGLIEAPLSDQTVARVASEILEGWTSNRGLRRLVEAAGAYFTSDENAPPQSHFGIWRLDRKDVYAEHSRLHSDGWGDSFGRGLANGENALVVNRILDVATPAPGATGEDLAAALRNTISPLKSAYGDEHLAVLLISASRQAWQLSSSLGFERSRQDDAIGTLDGVRVFEIYIDDVDAVALVVNFRAIGRWTRYTPSRKLPTEREIAAGLTFGVASISAEDAQQMLEHDRTLADQLGAATPAAAIRELRQRVSFRLMEAFAYDILSADAATKIPLPDED